MFLQAISISTNKIHPSTITFYKNFPGLLCPLPPTPPPSHTPPHPTPPPQPIQLHLSAHITQTPKDTEMYQDKHIDTRVLSIKQIIKYFIIFFTLE